MQDKDLKDMLKHLDVPSPSAEAKTRAIDAAMQAYAAHQKENAETRQGFSSGRRPIPATHAGWTQWFGRISMKKAYIFAGSATALALLAVTVSQYPMEARHNRLSTNMPMGNVLMAEKKSSLSSGLSGVFAAASPPPMPSAQSASPLPPPMASRAEDLQAMLKSPENHDEKDQTAIMSANNKSVQAFHSNEQTDFAQAGAQPMNRDRIHYFPSQLGVGLSNDSIADQLRPAYTGNDKFENFVPNPVKVVKEEPVSTFSIDVNTSSYSFVRRMITDGNLPPKAAVRTEEMINYFGYNYPLPDSKEIPFKPTVAVYPTPWNPNTRLLHIGIKGYDVAKGEKPRSNLVFLIDVSGSMRTPERLPLIKKALRMLVDELNPDDTVGIVVYASQVGTVLEPTPVSEKEQIIAAINQLQAGGSTNGGDGLQQAYALAEAHYDKNAVNRVILSTDGDFNVGITDTQQLQDFVEHKRDTGIYLSVLGVGQGNYNDAMMQRLAQHGNGNASYIDNLTEAHKVLVEEAGSTLFTIAKDVKIQVEFNPAMVSEYRLIGYESRMLAREDFNNDKVDAGDIGSGHAVTAIYEITPASSKAKQVDDLRYQQETDKSKAANGDNDEYAFLKIRYKLPSEDKSQLLTTPIGHAQEVPTINEATDDVRFATAVAAFGQLLKGDTHIDHYGYDNVLALADNARGKDTFGYRAEFINLVRLAKLEQEQQQ